MNARGATVVLAVLGVAMAACGGASGTSSNGPSPSSVPAATGQAPSSAGTGSAQSALPDDSATVPDRPDDGVTAEAIRIGWMGDLTGPTASAQTPNRDGIQAYFDFVNGQGGVLGRQLDLIVEDDEFNAETIVSNFRKLVDDDRVLALNHVGQSEVVLDDVEAVGIPLVGPPQTIDQGLANPWVFHLLAHYGDEADVAVARMADRVGSMEDVRAAVVHLELPSGAEWDAYIQQELEERGGTYVGSLAVDPGQLEWSGIAVQLKQLVQDEDLNYVAFHGAPSHALALLTAMDDEGVALPVVGIHGLASNSVYQEGPTGALDGVEGIHSFLPGNVETPGTKEMVAAVEGTEYEDDVQYLNFSDGWVDGMVIHQAILKAAEASGEVTRDTLHDALQSTFDVGGITCPIDWTESNHSPCAAPFEWNGEALEPVAPFEEWADEIDGEYGVG